MKAGFKKTRLMQALTNREWRAVRFLRQKYFFDKIPVSDPYTWTFDHKAHIHFVFYLGTIIIGYCHIQLWDDNRAALRIIVIDEDYRNQGMGSCLLENIEVWLRQQGIAKLQIQSSQAAYHFYLQHDYIKMEFDDPDNHGSDPRDIEIGKIL